MISALAVMGVAFACILLKLHIEKRRTPPEGLSDATSMSLMAFECDGSIFELFVIAGSRYSLSSAKIEGDFNRYLKKGDIPHYVRTFVRRHPIRRPSYQSKLFIGHEIPPSSSA